MAITFGKDLEALASLLASGGYFVRTIQSIPESRGRSADVYLENGVVVCWDMVTRKIWVDRFSRRGALVESFLENMCEGQRALRAFSICKARLHARTQSLNQSAAMWLLRSEGFIARNLRQQIGRP